MRDIPMFTTENGAASLIFREIPYTQTAYIRILDSLEPKLLIAECCDFCRCVGAERIYATGHDWLENLPLYTAVLEMRCPKEEIGETDGALWPVQKENLEKWRTIYNERMAPVANAAWMTQADAFKMLEAGEGYFVHRNGELLGIGKVSGNELEAVVSMIPGAGADVVRTLCHCIYEDVVTLKVASVNHRAQRLYNRLDFVCVREISRWFCVYEDGKKYLETVQ